MLDKLIAYFVDRHLLTNLIVVTVLVGGVTSWQNLKKEELPDVTFDRVMISATYPGATAEEVEHFVTRELEEAVEGIDGIYRVTSSVSQAATTVNVEIEQDYPNKDEVITEIRNAVLDADLPADVEDDPDVRVFKTSKKSIIDVALIDTGAHLLDFERRQRLQRFALTLEDFLINLPQVNSINRSGYFQDEIQIKADPQKLSRYRIPLSTVRRVVTDSHSRQPAGHIEVKNEPKVTINAQLDTIDKLNDVIVQAGFEGQAIALSEVADVENGFNREKEIFKVNGHEAVVFNVVKNSSFGILESLDAVKAAVNRFREHNLSGTQIDLVMLDDESIDVRNRLSIISINGAIGFILILGMLFLFLDKRSGIWVAMGIPFTVCMTMIGGRLLGYTVNNVTLAAVIIVMGMVVDDAIVVAENIGRMRVQGLSSKDAVIRGTSQVFLPVVASIVTTCIAFVPLFLFQGRHGRLNVFIPPIIFLMLGASLFESLLILPGHMYLELPPLARLFNYRKSRLQAARQHWFDKVEEYYGSALIRLLSKKYAVLIGFFLLLLFSGWVLATQMKFVMFPNEETRDIVITAELRDEADRYETAEKTREIEAVFEPYIGKEVVGVRTEIARSRRGGGVEENKFRMMVEIVPKEKRRTSADELIALWKPCIEKLEGLQKLVISKSRWGQSSGSAVEVLVQENNDALRSEASRKLAGMLSERSAFINVEIEEPILIPEYKIDFRREKVKRLSINPADISSIFRASLQGAVLYNLPYGKEEIDVRLSVLDDAKTDIEKILDIPVENNQEYLVPLRDLVTIEKTTTANSISRRDGKRTTEVYADIKPKSGMTPLEAADIIERDMFPRIIREYPSTALSFTGEIFDTRESQGDLRNALMLVLFLIFAVLAVLFNSLTRPLLIMLAIPFGMVGVVLAFWLHGKELFGFFAAIGALGLAGVVINDSIIMLSKLDTEFRAQEPAQANSEIARISQTRLKAVMLTTLTTVAGVLPTAYGLAGYDAMLSEMMLALAWGLMFGTLITLVLVPCLYSCTQDYRFKFKNMLSSATGGKE